VGRAAAVACLAAFLAACGTPSNVADQAAEVGSIAAEGALLAHDAAEGDTTDAFTRVHARALRRNVEELAEAIRDDRLAPLAQKVAAHLERLQSDPSDRSAAAELERALEGAARTADEIEMSP
jgi:5'-deoxynucleotidase YfbR-like HD superfamily hydrolase